MDTVNYSFELYEEVPDASPLNVSGSDVEIVARRLGGVSKRIGADENVLKDWCIHFYS